MIHELFRLGVAHRTPAGDTFWSLDGAPLADVADRDVRLEESRLLAALDLAGLTFNPQEQADMRTGYVYGYDDERLFLGPGMSLIEALLSSKAAYAIQDKP